MADEQSSVLSQAIRSNLCDKAADRRKQAALDIESAVRRLLRDARDRERLATTASAASTAAVATTVALVSSGSVASSSSAATGLRAPAATSAAAATANELAHEQVSKLIRCIADEYCRSAFPVRRKGGLIALASTAIALEHRHVQRHVEQLLPPVLVCFNDEDSGVRYNACEAFYNIAKVARGGVLPFFGSIFDGLCRLYADVDQAVKDGVQCVDRLVRDIVTESRNFCYADFIPMLTTRIKVLNPAVRQLVLGWLVLLDSVPQVDMMPYMPQYLEGLFGILASDNRDIRHSAEVCLSELLTEIRASAADRPARARRAAADAARTVARCCRAGERRPEDNYVRLRALIWLLELVRLQTELEFGSGGSPGDDQVSPNLGSGAQAITFASAQHARSGSSGLQLSTKGPLGLSNVGRGSTPAVASGGSGEEGLRQLLPALLAGALHCLDDGEEEIRKHAEQANDALRHAAVHYLGADVPVEAVVDVLLQAMREGGQDPNALPKCLSWFQLLLGQSPKRVLRPQVRDQVMEAALDAVARPEDEVAVAALRLLARIAAVSDGTTSADAAQQATCANGQAESATAAAGADAQQGLLADVCRRLFRLMASDDTGQSLHGRGHLAVRRLCEGVGAERVYATAARTLAAEKDVEFSQRLIRILHRTLLTARETRGLRALLRDVATVDVVREAGGVAVVEAALASGIPPSTTATLPVELLLAWFRCPVSALGLALWLHWFELAAAIAVRLARQEITDEIREGLDELAELLESPIFVRVRLQLLQARRRPACLRAVLGLLALRPNERALDARLEVVATGLLLDKLGNKQPKGPPPPFAGNLLVGRCGPRDNAGTSAAAGCRGEPTVDPRKLLARFDRIADQHRWRQVVM